MGWGEPPLSSSLPPATLIQNQPFPLLFLTQSLLDDNKTLSSKGLETRILGFHSHVS